MIKIALDLTKGSFGEDKCLLRVKNGGLAAPQSRPLTPNRDRVGLGTERRQGHERRFGRATVGSLKAQSQRGRCGH